MLRVGFKDGNAVLATHSTDDASESTIFRVHKSVMARHPPDFGDISSLPGAEEIETYDGVMSVRMDVGKDLQKLIDALHCQPPFVLVPFNLDTPSLARPVLALSTTYEVTHLREFIVERLEVHWPQTLHKWDELEETIRAHAASATHASSSSRSTTCSARRPRYAPREGGRKGQPAAPGRGVRASWRR